MAQSREQNGARISPDKKRLAIGFAVALISDLLSGWMGTVAPVVWVIDLVTALLLFVTFGRQWVILPGLIAEAIPVLAIFPTWVFVVGTIAIYGSVRPPKKEPTEPPVKK